ISSETPASDEAIKLLERFAKVFDLTFTRFQDLQKAEAQAREAQIEAALERVRSRTMAMHQTSELQEVIHTLHKELLHLDISIDGGSFVVINEDVRSALRCWGSGGTADTSSEIFVPDFNMPFCTNLIKGIKSGPGFFTEEFSQEEKKKYFTKLFKHKPWSELSAAQKKETLSSPGGYTRSVAVSKHTSIFIINHQGRKFTETENAILKRFAKVFEQTYTRFLDLQKAEAQAREAQIEIGLERVRSRAMAMQSSEELNALIGTVFTELTKLDLVLTRCIIWVFESATNAARWWMANVEEPSNPMSFFIKYHEHPAYLRFVKEWKNQNVRFVYDLKGKDKIKWDEILFNETELKNLPEVVKNGMRAPERVLLSASFNNFGGINVASLEPLSDEHFDILLRFAKVFDLTYTRFLDLKKAEEQAREAKIEAALERVRSRAMAMHTSQQLKEVAREMRTQLSLLGQKELETCAIHLWGDSPDQFEGWAALRSPDNTGDIVESESKLSIKGIRILEESFQQYQSGKKDYVLINDIEKAKEFFEALRTVDPKAYAFLAHTIKSKKSGDISAYWSVSDFDGGSLVMVTMKQPDEESRALLRRFANVFGLAYKRFKDLQKAEAQAREAQIEAAMERVRSKTMAMHSSQDIAATVDILFQELTKLHVETLRCGISIIHDTKEMEVWTANPDANGKSSLTIGTLPMSIYPSLEGLFDAWKNKESNFVYDLSGQDLVDYFTAINNAPDYPIRYDLEKLPPRQVINCFLFAEGALFAFTTQPLTPEASNIFKRFATLFGQTYRRYLDLQKAEMLAKEATIEAALEKVRGKAMAMHNSSDLSTTASTVFTELRKLGISPIRCGVGLLTKESRRAQLYSATSSASGDSLSLVGWVQLENHPVLEEIYDTWLQQKDYFPELQGEQLRSYYKLLLAGLSVPAPDFSNEQKQFGYFIPFSIGCLYAWSDVKYNDDELKILRRFATIIELTFRRYLELQQLEANAKEAVKQAALDRIRADIASMRTLGDLNRIIPLIWNELTILGLPFIRCGVFIMDNEHQLIHTFLSTPEGKAIAAFHIPYDTPGKIKLIPENWKKKTAYIDHWNDSDFIDFANTLVKQHVIDSSEQYLAGIPHGGFFLHFIPFLQGMMYVGNTTQLSEEDLILIQSVSDAFSTAYARYEDFNKLEAAKKQVDKTLTDLRQTQQQLVQSEKMASLGELTAGIAHEIQNPLNFVNNFSDVSTELLEEMKQELATGNLQQATELADDVIQNLEKILLHGKRADGIVKSMLQHSRASSGKKEPTDINAL
ncbi:MAG TPA: hypothetical protein VHD35_07340, partial [Chitinophagaceae bacterium]|nr:hypothetical protein [Chitinophagaceae bacterium]